MNRLARALRVFRAIVPALASLLLLSGCQTVRFFPTPAANWRTSIGQLQYATKKRSVIGEAVVSRFGGEHFQLDFTAGPGVPLMKLREAGEVAHAEGVFAHGNWQGSPAHALGSLAPWMQLREAFAALDAARHAARQSVAQTGPIEAVSPAGRRGWTARWIGSETGAERIQVQFPATGERFVFVFSK